MSRRKSDKTDDILSKHVVSVDDIFGSATPAPLSTPAERLSIPGAAPDDEVFEVPATETSLEPIPGDVSLTIPDDDGFLEEERRLYERALSVYDQVLETGSEKTRLQAAKDIVSIYTGRRDAAYKAANTAGGKETTNNHLHITVDSVKTALSAALHGMHGGTGTTQSEGAKGDTNDEDGAGGFEAFTGGGQ